MQTPQGARSLRSPCPCDTHRSLSEVSPESYVWLTTSYVVCYSFQPPPPHSPFSSCFSYIFQNDISQFHISINLSVWVLISYFETAISSLTEDYRCRLTSISREKKGSLRLTLQDGNLPNENRVGRTTPGEGFCCSLLHYFLVVHGPFEFKCQTAERTRNPTAHSLHNAARPKLGKWK